MKRYIPWIIFTFLLVIFPIVLWGINQNQEKRSKAAAATRMYFTPDVAARFLEEGPFIVDVRLDPESGGELNSVTGVDFSIAYSKQFVDAVEILPGDLFPDKSKVTTVINSLSVSPTNSNQGIVKYGVYTLSENASTHGGVVARIKFIPKAVGMVSLEFLKPSTKVIALGEDANVLLTDGTGRATFAISNNVPASTLSFIPQETITPLSGGPFTVGVQLTSRNTQGINLVSGVDLVITYSRTQLEANDIVLGNFFSDQTKVSTITKSILPAPYDSNTGIIKYSIYTMKEYATSGTGTVAFIHFTPKQTGASQLGFLPVSKVVALDAEKNMLSGASYANIQVVSQPISPTISPSISSTPTPIISSSITPTRTPTVTPSTTPTRIPTVTPTRTPTVTPSTTPTRIPTVTPTRTPTVTPSTTPTRIPTQTMTPTGQTYPLSLSVRFRGVTFQATSFARVVIKKAENEVYRNNKQEIVADSQGIFAIQLPSLPIGSYDVFIKGWAHTQKKFTFQVTATSQKVDFTGSAILSGDVSGNTDGTQDGTIDIVDIGRVITYYDKLPTDGRICDVNLDGVCDLIDIGYMITNYDQKDEN